MTQEEINIAIIEVEGVLSIISYRYSINGLNGIYDIKLQRKVIILNSILNRLINYDIVNYSDTYFYKLYQYFNKYAKEIILHNTFVLNDPLLPPVLTLVDTELGFNLSWVTSSGEETGYRILFSTDNIVFTEIATTTSTTYLDNDFGRITFSTLYYYAVVATGVGKPDSIKSNIISGQVEIAPPSNLRLVVASLTDIDIEWDFASVFNEYYEVEAKLDAELEFVLDGTTAIGVKTYTDTL